MTTHQPLRFRVIAYDPQTKQDVDMGIIEAESWGAAHRKMLSFCNHPRRMIRVTDSPPKLAITNNLKP